MEIRRLGYFIRIGEDGSLTKAAGVVRVAQSALSRQMRLREDELGVTLFDDSAGHAADLEGKRGGSSAVGWSLLSGRLARNYDKLFWALHRSERDGGGMCGADGTAVPKPDFPGRVSRESGLEAPTAT